MKTKRVALNSDSLAAWWTGSVIVRALD